MSQCIYHNSKDVSDAWINGFKTGGLVMMVLMLGIKYVLGVIVP